MPEGKGQAFVLMSSFWAGRQGRQALYACLLHTEKKDAEKRKDVAVMAGRDPMRRQQKSL